MKRFCFCIVALLFAATVADAQCPNGQCQQQTTIRYIAAPQATRVRTVYLPAPTVVETRYIAAVAVPIVTRTAYLSAEPTPVLYAAPVYVVPQKRFPTPLRDLLFGR